MSETQLVVNSIQNANTSDIEDVKCTIDEEVVLTPFDYEFKPEVTVKIEKKPRGRPRKIAQTLFFDLPVTSLSTNDNASLPRKRGRPRKEILIPLTSAVSSSTVSSSQSYSATQDSSDNSEFDTKKYIIPVTIPRRRGRPRKQSYVDDSNSTKDHSTPAKKLSPILADVVNVPNDQPNNIVKRKRGRPRKNLNSNTKIVVDLGKKKGKRGRPRLHDIATRPVPEFQRSSERIRRSARVLSPEFNSPHVLKNKTSMELPLDIPLRQIDPNFSKEEALSDLTALYNTVPDGMTYLFHAQVKGFIITLKEIMPNFNRDSSPRI